MANMFRTIEKQGGSNGPEWLSDHPNPGNRSEYIEQEAESLRVSNPVDDRAQFERVKGHLASLPPAPSSEEAARSASRGASGGAGGNGSNAGYGGTLGRVQPPSSRFRDYTEGNLFRISVPANWRELPASGAVTFAPDGAFGQVQGQSVFTHGVEVGVVRNADGDLGRATQGFIRSLRQSNPRLAANSDTLATIVSGRRALETRLNNVSDATNRPEVIDLVTTRLQDGSLFYVLAVAPESDAGNYQPTFQQVVRSIRLND
jgi:hypothetical protein